MKKFFKHYFILLLINCIFLILSHLFIQICGVHFSTSLNTLTVSYIFVFFVAFFFNIYQVYSLKNFAIKTKLLLLLLNPVNYLGIVSLCLVLTIWGKFEWQGFGF